MQDQQVHEMPPSYVWKVGSQVRNWYLLKDGNDDAFVMEAWILAGSSDTSFYKHPVVQAGLQAARTVWRVMREVAGLRLPAVPIVFGTVWLLMNIYRGIVVCCLFLGCLRWVPLAREDGEPRVWLSMRKWRCCTMSPCSWSQLGIVHLLYKGRRLGFFCCWVVFFESFGAPGSTVLKDGWCGVAKPALKMYWFDYLT